MADDDTYDQDSDDDTYDVDGKYDEDVLMARMVRMIRRSSIVMSRMKIMTNGHKWPVMKRGMQIKPVGFLPRPVPFSPTGQKMAQIFKAENF